MCEVKVGGAGMAGSPTRREARMRVGGLLVVSNSETSDSAHATNREVAFAFDGVRPHVGLFVTCIVDLFRPAVGFSAVKLLKAAGCRVSVPPLQTCCGQPAYNSGDRADARELALLALEAFRYFDYVVVPSGSCACMLKLEYPRLLGADGEHQAVLKHFIDNVYELVSFLADQCGVDHVDAELDAAVTYHDSCSALRELRVQQQPRRLLQTVRGLRLAELPNADVCCGFGGTFCVKYPDVSTEMVSQKVNDIRGSGATMVVSTDMGCLLNIAGRLSREGAGIEARHIAEILAGDLEEAPIGSSRAEE